VKVFVQAACCQHWFDCCECHDEVSQHPFQCGRQISLCCKTCRRVFQKDLTILFESDKVCENCQVRWCIPGEFEFIESVWICVSDDISQESLRRAKFMMKENLL
jgi:hypothetical protein